MVDQIILSCNEDPIYMEFWPIVSAAYKAMGFKCHLAFLTNRFDNDPLVEEFRQYGHVMLFPILPDIPQFGQAKMIRFILASMQGDQVCYVDDIDLFPLSKLFITSKVVRRQNGVLLCVGGEVYGHNGCYPISQMTAEGWLWKQFINPRYEDSATILRSFKDKAFYDFRENIMIETDYAQDRYFSDERLLKRLIFENPVPKLELRRGYDDFLEATIDRATVNKETDEWVYDLDKLTAHGYVNAHCARPYSQYKEQFEPLINYIKENY